MSENQGIKRPFEDTVDSLDGIKAVVFDIEGTITPITFVKETLFPYVTENLKVYIETHYDQEEIANIINELRELSVKDKATEVEGCVEILAATEDATNKDEIIKCVVENVEWQMSSDRKSTVLKKLQGIIWREGYKTGKIQGDLFVDVVPAFKSLIAENKKIYIYSSGSVEAQKLLLTYSVSGDITHHITDYFDTEIGAKTVKESYVEIAKKLEFEAKEIMFVTDALQEAKSAGESGMQTLIMLREGNAEIAADELNNFKSCKSFAEIFTGDIDANMVKKVVTEENGKPNGTAPIAESTEVEVQE